MARKKKTGTGNTGGDLFGAPVDFSKDFADLDNLGGDFDLNLDGINFDIASDIFDTPTKRERTKRTRKGATMAENTENQNTRAEDIAEIAKKQADIAGGIIPEPTPAAPEPEPAATSAVMSSLSAQIQEMASRIKKPKAHVNYYIDADLVAAATQKAKSYGLSMSKLVEMLLKIFVGIDKDAE